MDFPDDQVRELATLYTGASYATEGGFPYFVIPQLLLPEGCCPQQVDALLCAANKDGYASRLFFASPVKCAKQLNWNANSVRILDRNWYAHSWRTREGQRLAQMVAMHLGAFR
jgi:hypothetical protein